MSIAIISDLETLWQAARSGLITWASVQEQQNARMPRCAEHPDQPAPVYIGSTAVCADCAAAMVKRNREQ